jgi:hypothetical protein
MRHTSPLTPRGRKGGLGLCDILFLQAYRRYGSSKTHFSNPKPTPSKIYQFADLSATRDSGSFSQLATMLISFHCALATF